MRVLAFMCLVVTFSSASMAGETPEAAAQSSALFHYALGQERFKAGDIKEAEHQFTLSLVSDPAQSGSREARGEARFKLKNYTGAIEDFSAFLKENPQNSDITLLRGLARRLLKPEDAPVHALIF